MPLTHTTLPLDAFPEKADQRKIFEEIRVQVAEWLSCERTAEGNSERLVLDPKEDVVPRNDFWGEFDDWGLGGVLLVITGVDFYQDRFDNAPDRVKGLCGAIKDIATRFAHTQVRVRVLMTMEGKNFWASSVSE